MRKFYPKNYKQVKRARQWIQNSNLKLLKAHKLSTEKEELQTRIDNYLSLKGRGLTLIRKRFIFFPIDRLLAIKHEHEQ